MVPQVLPAVIVADGRKQARGGGLRGLHHHSEPILAGGLGRNEADGSAGHGPDSIWIRR